MGTTRGGGVPFRSEDPRKTGGDGTRRRPEAGLRRILDWEG